MIKEEIKYEAPWLVEVTTDIFSGALETQEPELPPLPDIDDGPAAT